MKIENFVYGEKPRKLLVMESTPVFMTGIELSAIPVTLNENGEALPEELQETQKIIKLTESMKASSDGKLSNEDFALIKPYMKYYKKFSKSKIVEPKKDVDTPVENK